MIQLNLNCDALATLTADEFATLALRLQALSTVAPLAPMSAPVPRPVGLDKPPRVDTATRGGEWEKRYNETFGTLRISAKMEETLATADRETVAQACITAGMEGGKFALRFAQDCASLGLTANAYKEKYGLTLQSETPALPPIDFGDLEESDIERAYDNL